MKKLRILAVIDLVLIVLLFGTMVAALFLRQNSLFLTSGSVLIAALIFGFVIRSARNRLYEEQKEEPGDE